ncbi:hypothetical protein DSM104299_02420 [Baekduia alba]|uniref:hypothetical protein n=1 Tax=Baekduia alba TaxID=2997333 RepID=UPI0023415F2C|nr:hypothetical protein [Baekduia alba]WCB93704.1 hypothetical protein DSM104299_02420 [Baekduia alba]
MDPRRLALAFATVVALLALSGGVAQAKAAPKCPAKPLTLYHDSYGRAWHTNGSLYSCTTVYAHKRVVRLGPWKTGGKLAWTATHAAWSVPLTRDGHVVGDRIYAGSTEDGRRWLLGTRALGAAEARIQRIFAWDATAAWVTKDGAVVFALQDPEDAPTAIGTLPTPPVARSHLTVVGAWTAQTPTDLGRTVQIDSTDEDGDECGGAADYRLTLAPDPTAPTTRVGVTWPGGWSRPFCG